MVELSLHPVQTLYEALERATNIWVLCLLARVFYWGGAASTSWHISLVKDVTLVVYSPMMKLSGG